jgi:hypothetical protein
MRSPYRNALMGVKRAGTETTGSRDPYWGIAGRREGGREAVKPARGANCLQWREEPVGPLEGLGSEKAAKRLNEPALGLPYLRGRFRRIGAGSRRICRASTFAGGSSGSLI